jgi:DNA (cytosine-5)-methyltransferase 1
MERLATSENPAGGGVAKPPFRPLTLADVRGTPSHGRTVASLFAGAGGSSTGYRLAGFRVVYANEFIPLAADTYAANYPETPVDRRDVRTIHGADILEQAGLGPGTLDVLDASPPCASFSTAGKRAKAWGEVRPYSSTRQRVDDLFGEYLRLVGELRPRVTVAENVGGLVIGTGKGMFKRILAALRAHGYRVGAQKLDAQWLGVPQRRQRVLIVGVRDDLDRAPAFPRPLPYRYGVAEALASLPPQVVAPDDPEIGIAGLAIGAAADWLVAGQQSARYFSLVLARPDLPCPTITGSRTSRTTACVLHWDRRHFTIPELTRLCGFPDDFVLLGRYIEQVERLGRAVPPPMMAALARAIAHEVFAV